VAGDPKPPGPLPPALRVGAALSGLSVALVLVAALMGGVPSLRATDLAERARIIALIEKAASQVVRAADEAALVALVSHAVDSGVASGIYARRGDGSLLTVHGAVDLTREKAPQHPDFALIELAGQGRGPWRLGIAFPPAAGGLSGALGHPLVFMSLLLGLGNLVLYVIHLRSAAARTVDEAPLIPDRVSTVMNGLVEGVALLDRQRRIVHCNRAFARHFAESHEELRGRPLSAFEWRHLRPEHRDKPLPWDAALESGRKQVNFSLVLTTEQRGQRIISVNVTPMFDGRRQPRAALASFDDRTAIFQKNNALRKALSTMDLQRREIAKQNEELKGLATRDSLTGCLNRRAFLEIFEAELLAAQRRGYDLACVMCDIDRFKSINDTHGHTAGDRVIGHVARLLQLAVRENDHICRYGGEEFCVLLPGLTSAEAATIAERMRLAIEAQETGLPGSSFITASFGVTDLHCGAQTLSELIDQADSAMYQAKAAGRNRVAQHAPAANVRRIGDGRVLKT
jgi:diguanylate cyclase (GGDEF)-like protein/PAS domain S-box-containing protein